MGIAYCQGGRGWTCLSFEFWQWFNANQLYKVIIHNHIIMDTLYSQYSYTIVFTSMIWSVHFWVPLLVACYKVSFPGVSDGLEWSSSRIWSPCGAISQQPSDAQELLARIETYAVSLCLLSVKSNHCSLKFGSLGVPDCYKPMIFKNGARKPFPRPTKKVKAPTGSSRWDPFKYLWNRILTEFSIPFSSLVRWSVSLPLDSDSSVQFPYRSRIMRLSLSGLAARYEDGECVTARNLTARC